MAKFNTKKGNKKGQKGRNVNVANKIKKKAIKTKGKVKGDARNLIRDRKIGKIRHGGDARDILANLAKGTDARQKLVKNRLLKRGTYEFFFRKIICFEKYSNFIYLLSRLQYVLHLSKN